MNSAGNITPERRHFNQNEAVQAGGWQADILRMVIGWITEEQFDGGFSFTT